MQVSGEARVGELRGSVVVVDKVDPPRGGVADLPSWRQRTEFLTVHIAQVSEAQRRSKTRFQNRKDDYLPPLLVKLGTESPMFITAQSQNVTRCF